MTTLVFALKNVNLDLPSVLKSVYEQLVQSSLQSASTAINRALEERVDTCLSRRAYCGADMHGVRIFCAASDVAAGYAGISAEMDTGGGV